MERRPPITFDLQSSIQGKDWVCNCGQFNRRIRKRVFTIPKFTCACGRKYLDYYDLDFSLTDIKGNGNPFVSKIYYQNGAECVANVYCQAMRINYVVDSVFKNKKLDPHILEMMPESMVDEYNEQHPLFGMYEDEGGILPDGNHKAVKMLLNLRSKGILLSDGRRYTIGDATSIPRNDFEAMCEEFANGVPLVAFFLPGHSFANLQYGQFYHTPELDIYTDCCSQLHSEYPHMSHTVVLTGPKTNHRTGEVGFHFVNSWPNWGYRTIIDKENHPGMVDHGLGNILSGDLLFNVLKFWQPGQSATSNVRRFRDEPEDSYVTDPTNTHLYSGV